MPPGFKILERKKFDLSNRGTGDMQGITSMIDMCSVGEFKNELSTGYNFVLSHRKFSHTFSSFHRREGSYLWVAKNQMDNLHKKKQKDAVNAKFS